MFLVSKDILSTLGKISEQLSQTSAVRAASDLPGFDASQQAFDAQWKQSRPAAQPAAPTLPAEGPSGGRFTEEAW